MIIPKIGLNERSRVIEIASNDGYLLQYFKEKHIPCFGIEPTECTARAAREKGIEVVEEFFGTALAEKFLKDGKTADLVLGNNVLAHVPDINDFVEGLKIILKPMGVITMEFPHLMQLVDNNQFDTIYHEHFSYLSLGTVRDIFRAHELEVYDVEELPTHGGSLRIYARHAASGNSEFSKGFAAVLEKEKQAGMNRLDYYLNFKDKVEKVKLSFLDFLVREKKAGKKIAAYGAAAKGNALLNYCGIKSDVIDFVVDAAPSKQGRFLPGSHIPVVKEDVLKAKKPDYVIILPWNIKDEIMAQLDYIKSWGGKFVVAIPRLEIY
jgi:SAM-dependent methyltransferase